MNDQNAKIKIILIFCIIAILNNFPLNLNHKLRFKKLHFKYFQKKNDKWLLTNHCISIINITCMKICETLKNKQGKCTVIFLHSVCSMRNMQNFFARLKHLMNYHFGKPKLTIENEIQ